MDFAERVTTLEPEGAYTVLARAQALEAAGREIIHLEIGQPDAPTFENIARAGMQAIEAGHTRYTPSAGTNALRKAIAEDAGRRRGMAFRPEQVVVGPGAKPVLFFPTLALVRPGDEVIYPDPGFPTYPAMIDVAGGVPGAGAAERRRRFFLRPGGLRPQPERAHPPDRAQLAQQPHRRGHAAGGAWSISPQLPRSRDFWVLSDEIYSRLVYERSGAQHLRAARHGRAHHHLRRLFQDLCHDRLAAGLRHHAGGAGASGWSCC